MNGKFWENAMCSIKLVLFVFFISIYLVHVISLWKTLIFMECNLRSQCKNACILKATAWMLVNNSIKYNDVILV